MNYPAASGRGISKEDIFTDAASGGEFTQQRLNSEAIAILKRQCGKHDCFVFTYRDMPVTQCNTKAWRKALKRGRIENFRWHDLRHAWAHLSSDHLTDTAERITVASQKMSRKKRAQKCSGTNLVQLNEAV